MCEYGQFSSIVDNTRVIRYSYYRFLSVNSIDSALLGKKFLSRLRYLIRNTSLI